MQDRLNKVLLDGETVRWSGRPAPFRLLQCAGRSDMILTWSLSVLLLLVSIWVIFSRANTRSLSEALLILLVVGFLPVLFSLHPLMEKWLLERNTLYAITNYRVIVLIRDELMYISLSPDLQFEVESQDLNYGTIRFDAAIGKNARNTLSHAVAGFRTEDSRYNMRGMLFYHIAEPEQLLQYFA